MSLFLLEAIQLVVSMLLWLIILLGRHSPAIPAPSPTVGATSAHRLLIMYGLFIVRVRLPGHGVSPWPATEAIAPDQYAPTAALLLGGNVGVHLGLFTRRDITLAGSMMFAAGRPLHTAPVRRRSEHANKRFTLVPLALIAGWHSIRGV